MKGTLYRINIIPSWVASKSFSSLYPGIDTGKYSSLWSLSSSTLYVRKAASSRQLASSLCSPGPLPGLPSFPRGKATSCRRHTQSQSIQPPMLLTKEKAPSCCCFLLFIFGTNHWYLKHSKHLINIMTWINEQCKVGKQEGFLNPTVVWSVHWLVWVHPTLSLTPSQISEAGKLKAPLLHFLTAGVTCVI